MNVMDSFRLDGRVAVITGGYGHLGKAMSMALKEANAKVFVAGRNKEKFLNAFNDTDIKFVEMDILNTKSIKNAFETIASKDNKIDILINNAVNLAWGDAFMDDKTWNSGVDGVLSSVFRCIREVVEFMKNGGSIINISSMYGFVSPDFRIYKGFENYTNPPHYGAAKAGVIQLTKYYAVRLAPKIRVNCISPGPFPSKEVQKSKGFIENLKNKVPLGRIGLPDELKGAVVFLASDASSFITGHNLIVDGGWTIW
ncbi:SDR family oxidoreductase [Hippea alviniae]|uniref:SDR family oxidoreductase n=1 Tax=Hippea alviniae TaxID=1279027 RepID=UPI0003B60B1C|nr:SDR family oxidoreductase [Hippea alviniae]